jgi:hypothetical protein
MTVVPIGVNGAAASISAGHRRRTLSLDIALGTPFSLPFKGRAGVGRVLQ